MSAVLQTRIREFRPPAGATPFALVAGLMILVHLTLMTLLHVPPQGEWHTTGFLPVDATGQFDAVWYTRIAEDGYGFSMQGASAYAFFPALPLLIRGLTQLTGLPYGVSGVLISVACGVTCVILFNRLARTLLDQRTATFATVAFMIYPYSMYLFGPVATEGLATTFVLMAFLLVEHDQVVLAGLAAAVASSSRFVVLALVLGLTTRVVERTKDRGWQVTLRSSVIVAGLSCCGQLAYMIYSAIRAGDPLAFVHAEKWYGWQGDTTLVQKALKTTYFHLMYAVARGTQAPNEKVIFGTLGLLVGITACLLMARIPRVLPRSYLIYSLGSFVPAWLGTTTFGSWGRLMIPIFPLFFVAGSLATNAPKRTVWPVAALALLGQALFSIAFSRAHYLS